MKKRLILAGFALLAAFCLMVAIWNPLGMTRSISTTLRWDLGSWYYKKVVLDKPRLSNGGVQHIEWDGWGMAGAETKEYLAYDPTDTLAGKGNVVPPGIIGNTKPCEVWNIRRLQEHWYVVRFFTNEDWGCD